jgi:hypothetical protein
MPTSSPTLHPTGAPTNAPTNSPTAMPTAAPTAAPTKPPLQSGTVVNGFAALPRVAQGGIIAGTLIFIALIVLLIRKRCTKRKRKQMKEAYELEKSHNQSYLDSFTENSASIRNQENISTKLDMYEAMVDKKPKKDAKKKTFK